MNIKADTVIIRLENRLGLFGIPSVIKTDNGAPFNGHVFSEFASNYGFKHRKITPLHPMSNATAEAFMKPLVKAIKTSNIQGQNWKSVISKFLLNYRSTPHPSTGVSPGELMFNRKMKTKLPQFMEKSKDARIRKKDTKAKAKNKWYADHRRGAKPSRIKPGDKVLIKQKVQNKLDTPFCPIPGTVLLKRGSMITAQHQDRKVTRDISHFKLVENPVSTQPSHLYSHQHKYAQNQPVRQHKNPPILRRSERKCFKPKRFDD